MVSATVPYQATHPLFFDMARADIKAAASRKKIHDQCIFQPLVQGSSFPNDPLVKNSAPNFIGDEV
jgi:hypothetical protein